MKEEYQIDLPDALEESVAVDINREIGSLELSLSILQDNYKELIKEHERIERTDLTEADGMELVKEKYFRYLHNYVTSVYTLIKHSQRVVQKYGDDDFSEHYSKEIVERDIHMKGAFLQQLRHYMQKRKLPPIQMTVTFDSETEKGHTTELALRKDMLMTWDGWTNEARDYLETLEEVVPLRKEFVEYQEKISSFYDWFFKYTRLYFKEEFDSARKVIKQIEDYKEGKMVFPREFVLPFSSEDFKV